MIIDDAVVATSGSQLELAVEITGRETCNVSATGEIDMATAGRLASLLESQFAAGRRTVQLDLRSVTFCSCACLRVLVDARNRFTAARGALLLTGTSPAVRRLLTLTGLNVAFHPVQPMSPGRKTRDDNGRAPSRDNAGRPAQPSTRNRDGKPPVPVDFANAGPDEYEVANYQRSQ